MTKLNNITKEKYQALIELTITKEQFKNNYTLKSRIGIRIAQIIGLLKIKWIK